MEPIWYYHDKRGLLLCLKEFAGRISLVYVSPPMHVGGEVAWAKRFAFDERNSPQFRRELKENIPGIRRLRSLAHIPVVYSRLGCLRRGKRVDDSPRAWLKFDPPGSPWLEVFKQGETMCAKDIPPGTEVQDGLRYIMRYVYGNLCVHARSHEFLGAWRRALKYHSRKLRDELVRAVSDEHKLAVFERYMDVNSISSPAEKFRLASVFFQSEARALTYARDNFRAIGNELVLVRLIFEKDLRGLRSMLVYSGRLLDQPLAAAVVAVARERRR